MKFSIYWLDGRSEVLEGDNIEDAFTKRGYGAGAVHAVDFYNTYNEETGMSHEWDKQKHDWVPKTPVINLTNQE